MNKILSLVKKRYIVLFPIVCLIFIAQFDKYSELTSSGTFGAAKVNWGGSSAGRFIDFIMKATAIQSNINSG